VRQTKIIATIGPASRAPDMIDALVAAGVDVFRLNFSHGTHAEHGAVAATIRETSRRRGREVAILQDLSGPKIRTGRLESGTIPLRAGELLTLRIGNDIGRPGVVSTTYAPLAAAVKQGHRLLLDDGRIELEVIDAAPDAIATRVVDGGLLGEHKGINAPNVPLPPVGVTAKDIDDLHFGLSIGVDLVALSFVQSADDLARARAIAADAGHPSIVLIAKLERPEAVERLPSIIDASDGVMVARGDLGLEMPLERVPQVQKQVLRLSRARGVPVIVATQVLESMRTELRPTRAEVSDAAGAVDSGADAIMLSGETAIGEHPVRVVEVLDSIVRHAEEMPVPWALAVAADERTDHLPPLCDAAVTLAARARADAIVGITREGRTARLLAARRPESPIVAATASEAVARRLCLWWGVQPMVEPLDGDIDAVLPRIARRLRDRHLLPTPATVVVVTASPALDREGSNLVAIRAM
jgi:pyruvate kinase